MNGRAVEKKYDTQIPAVHLGNRCPAANATIVLHDLPGRMRDDLLNPLNAKDTPTNQGLTNVAGILASLMVRFRTG